MTSAAIILAAGESSRMGRPKALLPWVDATDGEPSLLIDYQVRELAAAGVDDIVVVLGHEAAELRPHVPPEARVAVNEAYREGRASSLRAGAAALPDDAGPIAVLGVDQPRPRRVHERVIAACSGPRALIALPVFEGKRGHPAVLAGELLGELRTATEEARGLRGVIAAHEDEVREVAFMLTPHESALGEPDLTSMVVRVDINTPEDYEQALSLFKMIQQT